jgi:hypothetical protein
MRLPILIILPDFKTERAWIDAAGMVRRVDPKDRAAVMGWEGERTRHALELL